MLIFLSSIGIGTFAASVSYHIGGFWLGIPGFIIGFLLIPLLGALYGKYRKWAYPGEGAMQQCSCGGNKFKFDRHGGQSYRLCEKCGAKYKKMRHIIWIYENNEKRVYKRMIKFKGWE